MIPPFLDYDMALLPADDDTLPKWLSVHGASWTQHISDVVCLEDVQKINIKINRSIEYRAEEAGINVWQSPTRTWLLRTGDCKDYATLKYASLRLANVAESDMMVVCGDLNVGLKVKPDQHAFLLAMVDGKWRVLDSKFDQLILPEDYLNFVPIKAFSGEHGWLFSKSFIMSEKLA